MSAALSPKKSSKLSKGERTRARLLHVARQVLTEWESSASPMDEIALRAQVSRATVYSHFPNRDAILLTLLEEDWERQAAHYRELAQTPVVDHASVRKWLMREAASWRGSSKCLRLYSALCNQNAEAYEKAVQNRERRIGILGTRFAPFRIDDLRQPEQRKKKMAAMLIMFQIEGFCAYCSKGHAVGDVQSGADILTDTFIRFVEQGPSAP